MSINQIKSILAVGMLFTLALLIGVYLYWTWEGLLFHKVLSADQLNFTTTRDFYFNSEIVEGRFSVCKYRNIPAFVQWSLVDTYLRPYVGREVVTGKVGCYDNVAAEIEKISATLPPGDYYFSGTVSYRLNPLKTIYVPMKTNKFKVISGLVARSD